MRVHDLLIAVDPLSITQWLSPDFLVDKFGVALFWIGIVLLFIECGLFFPFLPGDTLLFAVGLFIEEKKIDLIPGPKGLDVTFAIIIYVLAAFGGNVIGYEIGRRIGPRIYHHNGKIIQRKHLDETSAFFDKHGNSALVIGRFVPVVRTYITLVAGVTGMKRERFFAWSAIGALLWVVSITLVGYFLGSAFPSIGRNIDLVTYGLLGVTVIGLVIEWARKRNQPDPGVPAAYRDDAE